MLPDYQIIGSAAMSKPVVSLSFTVIEGGKGDKSFAFKWLREVADSRLSSTTKLVLSMLFTFMDPDGGKCFPSKEALAARCSISKRAVIEHLHLASNSGFVRFYSKASRGGQGWRHHIYVPLMLVTQDHHDDGEGGDVGSPRNDEGGDPHAQRGDPHDINVVTQDHPTFPYNLIKDLQAGASAREDTDVIVTTNDPGWEPWLSRISKTHGAEMVSQVKARGWIKCASAFPPEAVPCT